MKKSDRISAYVEQLATDRELALDPCYQGYFTCFNTRDYYEAHDVLEHLWLQTTDANYAFYKGLIQLAGAFVHLKKHYEHPGHHKHGRRLPPAVRLFRLALANLEPFAPRHLLLDVEAVCDLARRYVAEIETAEYQRNPWQPETAPEIRLLPES